jgi:hypothetical protein
MESKYTYEEAVELERKSVAGEDATSDFEPLVEACL